ncbi:SH3 domain-containing protein [Streptomyces decoyicus]|uniref:SH3 domain-containing protein n=1 Tax=Streptomyces decoyicus TaxID=249567 RepID=UPI002E194E2A
MRKTRAKTAAVTLTLIGTTLTSGIAVASTPAATAAHATAGPTATAAESRFGYFPVYGRTLEAVTLRKMPSSSSTALGVIPKGVKLIAYEAELGHKNFKACGKLGRKWYRVGKDGTDIHGWVVADCLKMAR